MASVFVVVQNNKKGVNAIAELHHTREDAEASADGLSDATVKEMGFGAKAVAPKAKTTATKSKAKKTDNMQAVDDDEDDVAAEKPAKKATAAKASAKKNEKKEIPDGTPDSLKGLKLLFTGTFTTMDRSTCEETAEQYGATIIKKLADTDYIILGVRAGQKKLDEISEKGLETLTEAEFFTLLETGVSDEKRQQLDDRAACAEPPKKRAKK